MPGGNLGTAYEALLRGDSGPLLALLESGFEWVEPELAGYPLAGVHRGPDGVADVLRRLEELFDGFVLEAHEVAEAGERETVTGVMRGRPSGAGGGGGLPVAPGWGGGGKGRLGRGRGYFD